MGLFRCDMGSTIHRSAGSSHRLAIAHLGSAISIGVCIRSSGSDANRAEPCAAWNAPVAALVILESLEARP